MKRIRHYLYGQLAGLLLYARTIGPAELLVGIGRWNLFLNWVRNESLYKRKDKRCDCQDSRPYADPEAYIASFRLQEIMGIASLPQE